MLHFDEILEEDRKTLAKNKMIGNVRYTEQRLDEILRSYPANNGYDKSKLDFNSFMHRTDNAIKNEKKFCNEIKCLPGNVGSNIGSLIERMRQKDVPALISNNSDNDPARFRKEPKRIVSP